MKPLAAFVMRGPAAAALAVGLSGFLSLMLPFVGLLSSAALALVTLRGGAREGLRVGGLAALGCLPPTFFLFGTVRPVLVLVIILWLPVWGLGFLLRFSRSLAFAAQAGGLAVLGAVVLLHLLVPDPAATWLQVLKPLQDALVADGLMERPGAEEAFAALAPWLTGAFAAGLLLQVLLGLWIGRWWQALLYNPGGFGADFRAFRLHPVVGAAGLLLLGLAVLEPGPGLFLDLLLVLTPLWLFQGLAVIHQLRVLYQARRRWLVIFYALLVLLVPQSLVLVACLGLVDILVDVRARLERSPPA